MLCVKPYMLWKQHDREAKERKIRGDVELVENPYQVFNEVNYLTFRMFVWCRRSTICSQLLMKATIKMSRRNTKPLKVKS